MSPRTMARFAPGIQHRPQRQGCAAPTTLNGDVQGFGVLTINGDVFMDGPSKLDIDIGGTTQGTNYDELKVNGDATLGGTLNVNLV